MTTDVASLFYSAIDHLEKKEFLRARALLEECLEHVPGRVSVRYNLATTLCQLGKFEQAAAMAEGLLKDDPDNPDYLNLLASAIFPIGESARAISIYETLKSSGQGTMETDLNLLHALVTMGQTDKAESLLSEFAERNYPEASYRLSLATLRSRQYRFTEALALLDRILSDTPSDTEALFQRARLRSFRKDIDGALKDFAALDELGADSARNRTHAYLVRQQAALWTQFEDDVAFLSQLDHKDQPNCQNPFIGLLLPRSVEYEALISRHGVRNINERADQYHRKAAATARQCDNDSIRIGYMSANYRRHPSAHNITKLIEHHDRSRFRVIGFDLYGQDNSPERDRLKAAFDDFIDLSAQTDEEAGQTIRRSGVDILIDQMGHTARSRSGIFAGRNAPVQISYLGFPGTSGMTCMDYVIADRTVVQPSEEDFYTEAVCYMPDTYWPAEGSVIKGHSKAVRSDYGISDTAVAFCCFNLFQKITPRVFDRWMTILRSVPDSQLVLLEGAETAQANLRSEAEKRGVASGRLVFIPKVSPEEHLARQSLFDLFLDTSPYNAHTIGRDALYGGLPLITCVGDTFSDRVAASLLRASGLEELITTDERSFVDLAIELGSQPEKLQAIRAKLQKNLGTHALFDTPRFARNIETAFIEMNWRSKAGKPHTSFSVADCKH